MAQDRVPVLLVTGVLGAGKTTLINRLLQGDHGLRLAAVVNDFGAINIDEAILANGSQPVYGLKNGCICCSLQGDLLRTLRTILSFDTRPDGIVIEASGVSDPRNIIVSLFDPVMSEAIRLDGVVTVVDAEEYDAADALWQAQVHAADFIVVAKTADVDPLALAELQALLGSMSKALVFQADSQDDIPVALLFGASSRHDGTHGFAALPHITDDRFARLEWSCKTPLSLARLQSAIQAFAPGLARAKGYFSALEKPGEGFLFQLVGRRAQVSRATMQVAGAQLVFIGKADRFDPGAMKAALDKMQQEILSALDLTSPRSLRGEVDRRSAAKPGG